MKLKLYKIVFDNNNTLITRDIGEITGEYNKHYGTTHTINSIRYLLENNKLSNIVSYEKHNLYEYLRNDYENYINNKNISVNTDRTKNRIYNRVYNEYVCNL